MPDSVICEKVFLFHGVRAPFHLPGKDLGKAVKSFADAGKLIPNYDYAPDDHYSVLGAEMQKYLADQCTREDLAKAYQEYWKAQA